MMFQNSCPKANQPTPHRLFGFLLGATASGAGMYYYVVDEYRVSNQLLTEDIYVRVLFLERTTVRLLRDIKRRVVC